MASVDDLRRIVALDNGLATLGTLRPNRGVHLSVVNAGVVDHPTDGSPVGAFVASPATRKVANLRRDPTATLQWRSGWAWVAAEGPVELIGPEDDASGTLPGLLRTIFTAAGGQHEDWTEFDRVMAAEQRLAVLLRPTRIYTNP